MNQVAIVYEKETRKLIATMEFRSIVTDCNILKIPGVEVVITMKVDGLFYVKDNEWHVKEQLIYKQ
ncbi:hypothetical protein [Zhenhengia sp.]|uniref:hypothetical protein n=1 Tax=Zhenhengia sp. TaxID=2944208 RepID=UPI00204F6F98|nr:MAG TPA: hypothetical protein [Caudoviricetes sp.]